jgi:molybdenum cofactor sulfurtransferase
MGTGRHLSLKLDAAPALAVSAPNGVNNDVPWPDEAFRRAYPVYATTRRLDALRDNEYARLDRGGHVYLDYTAGSLYAESQVRAHLALLADGVFGNPHSLSPTSSASACLAQRARAQVLEYFGAAEDEYAVVFTPNASGALKLVGESFPFLEGGHYLLTADNHNSVNGIREFARARGAAVTYVPVSADLRVDESELELCLERAGRRGSGNLFAYPAQSNFSGVQHPLEWIERAHARGWDVLLDAAAFAPTNRLDLRRHRPDFVDLSFYKMFGYPTGVGCLIARRSALARLRRPWFAGGTIDVASVQTETHSLAEGAAGFEDGTVDYLSLPAVGIGLDHLQSIGIDTIHDRVRCLSGWLLDRLAALRHGNGAPLVRLYGPWTLRARGGTLALNFLDARGHLVDHAEVERRAAAAHISLRTGCFCNPGAAEAASGIARARLAACFGRRTGSQRLTRDGLGRCLDGHTLGAVRVSLGVASNLADVERFLAFAATLLDD